MTLGGNLTTGLTAIVGWHAYLWYRLVYCTSASRYWRAGGAVVLTLLAALIPTILLHPPWLGYTGTKVMYAVTFGWLGVGFLLFWAVALTELVRAGAWIAGKLQRRGPPDPARREALGKVLGGAAAAFGVGVAAVGAAEALALVVQRVRVPLRRLPPAMIGTRIVQITDLHFGGSTGPEYLERVVDAVNALKPDIVAITGDLVDGTVNDLGDAIGALERLSARHGVFFVTGNHEYYYGAVEWVDHLETLGIRVLRNERVSIGEPGASFDLAGVDDRSAAHHGVGHGHDLPKALEGREADREVVLLAHQPATVREAAELDVGLQLSGHTHGGQIFPLKFLLYLEQPFVDGLHKLRETYIYVSRGTGYWGPPMRVGAPAEISEITLVRG